MYPGPEEIEVQLENVEKSRKLVHAKFALAVNALSVQISLTQIFCSGDSTMCCRMGELK